MRRFAGSCRFVFNKALALQKERYEQGKKKLGYAGLCKLLTEWRNGSETPWLADAPVHPLQQTLKDLERAYANFFAKRADFPHFKKKGQSDSFRYPDPKQIRLDQANARIFLPKPRLAALPQQPRGAGRGEEHHREPVLRQMVREHPRPNARSSSQFQRVAQSASTWALHGSPRSRMARSTRRSTASGGMKRPCAARSRP